MPMVQIRPQAWRDIDDISEYLDTESGIDQAERFVSSVLADWESLSTMPHMGALCEYRNQSTRDIRRWPVAGFERWLIFYNPLPYGIEVVRVLHGARDLDWIFD